MMEFSARCTVTPTWLPLIVLFVLAEASLAFPDDFFGDGLSERERYEYETSQETMSGLIEGLGYMRLLAHYEAFADGRCEYYFEVESAAKNGDEESQHFLSDLYRKGYCVPQDDTRALFWVRQAAEGDYAAAYFDLGIFLLQGIGISKDPRSAAHWLDKATDNRTDAYYYLAVMYLEGEGVPQNFNKAYEYAISGAAYGDPPAQVIVAILSSESGYDFSDPIDSYKWASIAKASGQPKVVEAIAEVMADLESTLNSRQIAKAQDAAINWTPLEQNQESNGDPTIFTLPLLDEKSTIKLSSQQATSRLAELGLENDRFLFFKAIAEDNLAVTALYVRSGASPETVSPILFRTPLLHAAGSGSERVARFLVDSGADIDQSVNHDNDSPVLLAISGGHLELAIYLIDLDANLDHPGIMYNAVEFNDPNFLALLKSKGVAIDEDYVSTPLKHAVSAVDDSGERRCHDKSAEFLIKNGARTDVLDSLGQSLIDNALHAVNPYPCVALLLANDASLSAAPGREPLFLTMMLGNADLFELLLEHGADPNLRFSLEADQVPYALDEKAKEVVMNGGSLLQVAVEEQHATIARLLIRHGADPNVADRKGRTPLSAAKANGDELMVSVLEGKM